MHALELARMGANIRIEGRQAIVAGGDELMGAQVQASRSASQRFAGSGGTGCQG